MNAPLTGLRVLDLTDESGHLAGRILADLGADVLKIEPPGGDAAAQARAVRRRRAASRLRRRSGSRAISASAAWCSISSAPAGVERLRALAREADVLIESAMPGDAGRASA